MIADENTGPSSLALRALAASRDVCNSHDGIDAHCDRPAEHLGDHAGFALGTGSVVQWANRRAS